MEKKEAKSLGLKRFNTGRQCKRGHTSDRWTSTGMCIQCLNERSVTNYWLDPEAARSKAKKNYNPDYQADYYKSNECRIKSRNSKWLEENGDKKKAIDKEYRVSNKVKVKTAKDKWQRENPDKRAATDRNRRSRLASAQGTHTADDVRYIMWAQSFMCYYCGIPIRDSYHVDHIMPIALGGGNGPDNLQCLCPTCNLRKGALHPDTWVERVANGI